MGAKRRIAVLWHERQQEMGLNYMVTHYADVWKEDGHEVVFLFGTREFTTADVVIVHVDLSVVPDEYLEFAARFPIAVNGKVRDIRKSKVSTLRLQPNDAWSGRVIVKSDLNFAGLPERRLGLAPAGHGMRLPNDYRVYDSIAAVPPPVWQNAHVIVERFLPQVEDGEFVVQSMVFLGEQATCSKNFGTSGVLHTSNQTRSTWVEPHPEVMELRRQLGFDMGKFDYVIHEGKPVVFDTNKTVGAPVGRANDAQRQIRRQRAQGLYPYLEQLA